ncbi:MAG: thiol-disulfide oxidoreductase DCC family protein [Chthoniobacterales bacterium]
MRTLIYDGECGFCSASIRFIWKRDATGKFTFAQLQSPVGKELLAKHGVHDIRMDTVYLVTDEGVFSKSDAAIHVLAALPRWHWITLLMRCFPRVIRNRVYDFVARHRKQILNQQACELPPAEVRERFL